MTKHEKDLKKPDAFLHEGRKILMIFEKNQQSILIGIAIFALVVGGIFLMGHESEKKELALQTDYYRIEKSYLKKMEEAEKAKNEKLEKEMKPEAEAFDKSGKDKKSKEKAALAEAKKDAETSENKVEKYKDEIAEFRTLMDKAPESKAGAMAALTVANLYFEMKNWEDGYKVLDQVFQKQKKNNLMKGLLTHSLGVAQANMGKCDVAVQTWGILLKDKAYDFMADELKLKTAICQEQLGQSQQAEELLNAIKAKTDSPQSKIAEKYLRFYKSKKQGS
jgi:predicted negative regulator of RcsB-dependent stress response